MKRFLLIFVILAALGSGGYWVYQHYVNQEAVSAWQLVPQNAAFVYETNNLVENWNALQKQKPWETLLKLPAFASAKADFEGLDSLSGQQGAISKILKGSDVLISGHPISQEDFDFVFYVPFNGPRSAQPALKLLESFKKKPSMQVSKRKYRDFTIHEIRWNANSSFTYILYHNLFVGSFTPFLIEDVIRTLQESDSKDFKAANQNLFSIAKISNDDGNLYLNYKNLAFWLKRFHQESSSNHNPFATLANLAENASLDLSVNDKAILLNGFSKASSDSSFLHIFHGQKGHRIAVNKLVSDRTASLYVLGMSDANQWANAQEEYWKKEDPEFLQQRKELRRKYTTDFGKLTQFIHQEVALATLASINTDQPDRIAYLKLADLNGGLNTINKLSEEAAQLAGDTLYYEQYGELMIKQLEIPEFPKWLLGPQFSGFPVVYYTTIGNYLLFANNIQAIKSLVTDLESENVWGKSNRINQFLESGLQDANVSYIVSTSRSWDLIRPALSDRWRKLLDEHPAVFRSFDLVAMQFSQMDKQFYTNLEVHYKENTATQLAQQFETTQEVSVDAPIITKPFVVRNHNTQLPEVLVQDSTYHLYLISNDGNILWKDSLSGPIVDDIYQIDYYKNGFLQYLIATPHKVYLIDRNGNTVADYPLVIPTDDPIQYLSVVDYDKSKRYRFMVSTDNGDIYLFDKEKNNLEGWQPRKIAYPLACRPTHLRVRSRDFMIALQQNGNLNLMSRQGEMKPHFPVDLSDRVHNPMFFEIGNSFESSNIVTITDGGQLVKTNLLGTITDKKQLYRPTKETAFSLCIGALSRTYAIARQDLNRMSIMNRKGEVLFEKDYLSSEKMDVQYYNYGTDQEIFAVTDPVQEFTYLYDARGNLINYQPLESSHNIGLLYYENEGKFLVYKVYKNKFSICKFSL